MKTLYDKHGYPGILKHRHVVEAGFSSLCPGFRPPEREPEYNRPCPESPMKKLMLRDVATTDKSHSL